MPKPGAPAFFAEQRNLGERRAADRGGGRRIQRADGAGPGQERQQVPLLDDAGELGQAIPGPACLSGQDQPCEARPIEFLEVAYLIGDAVRPHQQIREQVHGEHCVAAVAHRGRDVAVEREAATLVIAGLHDLAGQAGGEVDLEPVPRERVMPQDDVSVARGADIDIAAEAQHPVRPGGEDAHSVLARVKIEVPHRPGGHLLIIYPLS